MANQEQLKILKQGVKVWNRWREKNPGRLIDLSGINFYLRDPYAEVNHTFTDNNLYNFDLRGVDLSEINFEQVNLRGANLTKVIFRRANLVGANFTGAVLRHAKLEQAKLLGTKFEDAELIGAILDQAMIVKTNFAGALLSHTSIRHTHLKFPDLRGANLSWANLSGSSIETADMRGAILIETNLSKTTIYGCAVYGISAWNLNLEESNQQNLLITNDNDESIITVDNIEVAQFIYLLLNNQKLHQVFNTITSKVVLILGRFSPEPKKILDLIKDELRKRNYLPVIFDFQKPERLDLTETVGVLARLARFIIADLTDPNSIPHELYSIIPDCMIPVKPILLANRQEYSMFKDLRIKYEWVLEIYHYQDASDLLLSIQENIIEPAEQKAKELEKKKR